MPKNITSREKNENQDSAELAVYKNWINQKTSNINRIGR